jgi:hypothetical protein
MDSRNTSVSVSAVVGLWKSSSLGIEGLNNAIVGELARPTEVDLDAVMVGLQIQHLAGELTPVVHEYADRYTWLGNKRIACFHNVLSAQPQTHANA